MALSLGFGILFATVILALLVPALYLIVEDLRRLTMALLDRALGEADPPGRGSDSDR